MSAMLLCFSELCTSLVWEKSKVSDLIREIPSDSSKEAGLGFTRMEVRPARKLLLLSRER